MLPISPFEKKLFAQLLAYRKKMSLDITFRVAGGWVRDRIMGTPSEDIDIAIDKMSGAVFSKGFIRYLRNHSEEVHGYHVVAFNHSKAKHLETASLKYSGYSIDFVALRTEEYTESRIPMVGIGTPQEDAHRRDITINSLFYNINTMKIEDYTGKGLQDIKERKIRTPLDPMYTFLDDPLRILRVLRFSARLSFGIVQSILDVLSDRRLHEKLARVVSKERVGQEIRKILGHKGYDEALITMARHGLIGTILPTVEVRLEDVEGYVRRAEQARREENHPMKKIREEDLYILRIFGLMQNNHGKKEGKILKTEHAISEYLKWTRKEKKMIVDIEIRVIEVEKILRKEGVPRRDKLVQIARKTGEMVEEVMSLFDLLQHRVPENERIKVAEMYTELIEEGFRNQYKGSYAIDFTTIKKEMRLPVDSVLFCMERYTQLSILHKGKDREYLIDLLKKEMAHPKKEI